MMRGMTTTLDLTGVDMNDVDEVQRRWDRWVGELFAAGYRPGEEPLPWSTDTTLVYSLTPVGGVNDFNREAFAEVHLLAAVGA